MNAFCERYNLSSLIKKPTCYKNPANLSCNSQAPSKKKYTRGNHLPFINKELSKAIMNSTRLRNVYLRKRSDENRKKYSKQRNYCVLLLRRTKRKYYSSLDEKSITDNKTFWRTSKPLPSEKSPSNAKITLQLMKQLLF